MADQDKQLPATARKLEKAREDGQVARSRDLGHLAAIAVGGGALIAGAPTLSGWLRELLANGLRFNASNVQNTAFMGERLMDLAMKMLIVVLPMGTLMALVGLGTSLAMGGWVWTMKPMSPDLTKLNPLSGLGRLFSKHQMIEALKAALLALILGTIGAFYLKGHVESFGGALSMPLPAALSHAGDVILGGLMLLLVALVAFAVIDVPLQRKMHLDKLKMSHEEVKQEHKDIEGNMQMKAKIRQRMREVANRRMIAAVPSADLVVMNPTHYAVALKYDEAAMGAPRVIAKGADLMAMKIRDVARDAQVPVLQAPVLARALYAHAEVDREIPAALFSAVAQVLAYVYQLRAALSGRMAMPGALPELNVPPELDPHNKPGR